MLRCGLIYVGGFQMKLLNVYVTPLYFVSKEFAELLRNDKEAKVIVTGDILPFVHIDKRIFRLERTIGRALGEQLDSTISRYDCEAQTDGGKNYYKDFVNDVQVRIDEIKESCEEDCKVVVTYFPHEEVDSYPEWATYVKQEFVDVDLADFESYIYSLDSVFVSRFMYSFGEDITNTTSTLTDVKMVLYAAIPNEVDKYVIGISNHYPTSTFDGIGLGDNDTLSSGKFIQLAKALTKDLFNYSSLSEWVVSTPYSKNTSYVGFVEVPFKEIPEPILYGEEFFSIDQESDLVWVAPVDHTKHEFVSWANAVIIEKESETDIVDVGGLS